jgi:hypothetical protein
MLQVAEVEDETAVSVLPKFGTSVATSPQMAAKLIQ